MKEEKYNFSLYKFNEDFVHGTIYCRCLEMNSNRFRIEALHTIVRIRKFKKFTEGKIGRIIKSQKIDSGI
jgi:hypothetical protein